MPSHRQKNIVLHAATIYPLNCNPIPIPHIQMGFRFNAPHIPFSRNVCTCTLYRAHPAMPQTSDAHARPGAGSRYYNLLKSKSEQSPTTHYTIGRCNVRVTNVTKCKLVTTNLVNPSLQKTTSKRYKDGSSYTYPQVIHELCTGRNGPRWGCRRGRARQAPPAPMVPR